MLSLFLILDHSRSEVGISVVYCFSFFLFFFVTFCFKLVYIIMYAVLFKRLQCNVTWSNNNSRVYSASCVYTAVVYTILARDI